MFRKSFALGLRRNLFTGSLREQLRPVQWLKNKRFQFVKRLQSRTTSSKKGIKSLMQEYGYSALGVYLLLSCIDFPICFVIVHNVGVDKVHDFEEDIKNKVKSWLGWEVKKKEIKLLDTAEENKVESSSFWNNPLIVEGIVAYALHKSLVFIRVPITAAITPKFVSQLRKWGFKIGDQKLRTIAQQAKVKTTSEVFNKSQDTNISNKFGTSPNKKQKWWSWFF